MAIATAVSAAEMAIENRAKKCPSNPAGNKKRLNTAKFMSVAFRINSMDQDGKCVAAGKETVNAGKKHDSGYYQVIFHVYTHNLIVYVQLIIRL